MNIYLKSYYISTHQQVTGSMVNAFCKSRGMDSLLVDSEFELKQLKTLWTKNGIKGNVLVGAKATDVGNRIEWYWESSGNRVNFPIRFTADGPSNSAGDEYCLEMVFEEDKFGFNELSCNTYTRRFFCEKVSQKE
jgi:hypothetical protein